MFSKIAQFTISIILVATVSFAGSRDDAKTIASSNKGIGAYLLEKTKGQPVITSDQLQKARCPDTKYCSLKPKDIVVFMQTLDELGRDESPLVLRNYLRFKSGGKHNYDQIIRRRLGISDPELILTARQITRTLGEALEIEEIQYSHFMSDVKLQAPDLYESFDRRFDKIRGRRIGG
jgi:hypothetical protein